MFKMAAMTSFQAENCSHLVRKQEASVGAYACCDNKLLRVTASLFRGTGAVKRGKPSR